MEDILMILLIPVLFIFGYLAVRSYGKILDEICRAKCRTLPRKDDKELYIRKDL